MATIFLVIVIGIVNLILIDKLYEMIKELERQLVYFRDKASNWHCDSRDAIEVLEDHFDDLKRASCYNDDKFHQKLELAHCVNRDLNQSSFSYNTITEMETIRLNKINNTVKCCPSCKYWKACAEQDSNVYGRCLANNWDFYIGCKDPHSMWCNSYEGVDEDEA